jgi:hypothetical protein
MKVNIRKENKNVFEPFILEIKIETQEEAWKFFYETSYPEVKACILTETNIND